MNTQRHKIISAAALWLLIFAANTRASADVLQLKLEDQITPASAEVIVSAITRAERDGSAALIITLNTPGGLDTSMREIISRIITSRVPIIVYVAPSGARAASAGFVILISADVAAMAPGTETGAAHPVLIGGGEMSKTMTEKVVNDAAAYVRSLAVARNRDPQAAESSIRESRSFTNREALDNRLIDIIARDEWDLLAQLNGRTVTRFDGSQKVLQTANEKLTIFSPTFRQRLLMCLVDPRVAFVLFAIGALCVYFEFQHPGLIAPGLVLAVVIPFALILIVMVRLALRARETRVSTGLAGMIGLKGRAETMIAPEGRVFVRGELWRARSQTKIAAGENVRVLGVEGLTLEVDLAERDAAVAPKQASAIEE